MIFFNERQLRKAVTQYPKHYHHERNHQGLDHQIIEPEEADMPSILKSLAVQTTTSPIVQAWAKSNAANVWVVCCDTIIALPPSHFR